MLAHTWALGRMVTMLALDIRTLTLAIAVVSLVAAFVLLAYWRSQRTHPGFGYWVAANFLVTASFVLFGLRGMAPAALSVGVANVAAVGAVALRLESVRQFRGKPGFGVWSTGALLAATPFILYFSLVEDDPLSRTLIVSFFVGIYALLIGWAFLDGTGPRRDVIAMILALFHVFTGLIVVSRALLWLFVPSERSLLAPTAFNLAFFFSQLLADVGISVSFLALHAQRATAELEESRARLEALASVDALTGALNRRTFFYRAETEFARARRLHQPLSILMLDLDHFKQVNDSHGHAAGDAALKQVIGSIGRHLREIDRIGRIGGEEFAILLPGSHIEGAAAAAERLRAAVEERAVSVEGTPIHLTVSIGVAELAASDSDVDALLKRADEVLYDAKRNGRNRFEISPSPGVESSRAEAQPAPADESEG